MAQELYEQQVIAPMKAKKEKAQKKERPIMFSLAGRGTENWPDHDSSDSDYVPEDPATVDVPPPNNPDVPHVKITIRYNGAVFSLNIYIYFRLLILIL